MATKAAEIKLGTTTRPKRRTSFKSLAKAFKEWGQKGQLAGYTETQLSREAGGRV